MPNQYALRDQTNAQPAGTFWGNRFKSSQQLPETFQTPNRGGQQQQQPRQQRTPLSGARPVYTGGNDNATPQSVARAGDSNYIFNSHQKRLNTPGSASSNGSPNGLTPTSVNGNSAFKYTSSPMRPLFKKYLLRELEAHEKAPYVTVVFDLDETLVSNRRADLPEALLRAYCIDVLHAVRRLEGVEVVLWTASTEETGSPVVDQLEREGKVFDQVIFRSDEWFTEPMHTKDLRLLGRPMDRVIVFDNAPNCVKLNRFNAILVEDYHGGENPNDETLANIFKMCETLRNGVAKGCTVPDMLKSFAQERDAGVYTVQYALPEAWQRTNLRDLSPVMIPAQGKFFKITQEHLPEY